MFVSIHDSPEDANPKNHKEYFKYFTTVGKGLVVISVCEITRRYYNCSNKIGQHVQKTNENIFSMGDKGGDEKYRYKKKGPVKAYPIKQVHMICNISFS